jgi:RNA polymerase sigma factor (sigma-70 family)
MQQALGSVAGNDAPDGVSDRMLADLLHEYRAEGQRETVGRLLDLLLPELPTLARRVVARTRPPVDAEDLIGEFTLCLLGQAGVGSGPAPVRSVLGWAHTIMRNNALSHIREIQRSRVREQIVATERRPVSDPAQEIERKELEERLVSPALAIVAAASQSLRQMPRDVRDLLRAREDRGLTYDQIADDMGIPRSQVGMRLKRARARFGRRVEDLVAGRRRQAYEAAGLLYEMSRACALLSQGPYTDRVDPIVEPASYADLAAVARPLLTRIGEKRTTIPAFAPSPGEALDVGMRCLELSEELTGSTFISQYGRAAVAMLKEEYAGASSIFRELDVPVVPVRFRSYVRRSLSSIFLRQCRPRESVEVCQRALQDEPTDQGSLLNLATAHAQLGDRTAFRDTALRYAAARDVKGPDLIGARVLNDDASIFGELLGQSAAWVRSSLRI